MWRQLMKFTRRVRARGAKRDRNLKFYCEPLERRHLLAAAVYEPGIDTDLGFNMTSFVRERSEGRANWVRGVESLSAAGATEVTFAVYRELNADSGKIKGGSGPKLPHIEAAVKRAKELGMHVTLTPTFEVAQGDGEYSWRGEWNPEGKTARRFSSSYRSFVSKLARIGERHDIERLNVGSELQAFVSNPAHGEYLAGLITRIDRLYSGQIGYVANWSNYDNPQLAATVWNHTAVDYLAISAYFSEYFATPGEADDSGSFPDDDFIAQLESRWNDLFDLHLIPFANAVRGGEGLPLVIQEFGAVPFNRTTVLPWSTQPGLDSGGTEETLDPAEQTAIFQALIQSLDGRRDEIASLHFWTWSFDSNRDDLFGLDPNMDSPSQPAAQLISNFLHTAGTL